MVIPPGIFLYTPGAPAHKNRDVLPLPERLPSHIVFPLGPDKIPGHEADQNQRRQKRRGCQHIFSCSHTIHILFGFDGSMSVFLFVIHGVCIGRIGPFIL